MSESVAIDPYGEGSESAAPSSYPPSVNPGIPKLKVTPEGWRRVALGVHLYEVKRPAKLTADQEYTLVTVKRSRGGVIKREKLRGAEIKTPTQFFVKDNDFLISRRQIVHGACGLVPVELDGAIVSNEYAVLDTDGEIDLGFLRYLSETHYFQQTCFHSSIGVHVEKMVFKLNRWLKWQFNIPPLTEQHKITEVLGLWDSAIKTTYALLSVTKKEKLCLSKKLLGPAHPGEWKTHNWQRVSLNEIADVDKVSLSSGTDPEFSFRYISLADVANGKIAENLPTYQFRDAPSRARRVVNSGDVLMSTVRPNLGGHARLNKEHADCVASTGFSVISCKAGVNPDYVYHYLFSEDIQKQTNAIVAGSNYPAISSNDVSNLMINIPTLELQSEVANILNTCDRKIFSLEQQAQFLGKEKRGLLQQLLNGKKRVKLDEAAEEVTAA